MGIEINDSIECLNCGFVGLEKDLIESVYVSDCSHTLTKQYVQVCPHCYSVVWEYINGA